MTLIHQDSVFSLFCLKSISLLCDINTFDEATQCKLNIGVKAALTVLTLYDKLTSGLLTAS